ncbi:small subunit ribosomal protein S6 [Lachnospiraceae bacterium NK3A20]|nr:small subunit ribosomal protein S6 [Lachnospiraceae bacterium NK3A20]
MSKYELAVVVNAQIDDDARAAVVNNVKELVERFGAQNTEVDDSWGKKKLAYPIQKMDEGYYYFVRFEAETTAIAEIESRMRIMDNVLRYLCVKQNEA